ncbi:hypothetical protein TIFTF001_002076 [Ficus carica]|uniref:Transmembrane protein n=1 Tax=Ficus carica TaxID=3494 RepID=A0AA88CSI6_FICCA|nr:hypothetical protein TIFTF001_002076 [Ficus carica]
MDDNSALIEALLREDEEMAAKTNHNNTNDNNNRNDDVYGWQTVSYSKKNKKPSNQPPSAADGRRPNGVASAGDDVFRSIEVHSEERRRRASEAQVAASAAGSKQHSDDNDGDEDGEVPAEQNGGGAEEARKAKPKKPKKPKATVAEAAKKIDADHLEAFLADITANYESRQDIQLMRFADYFGRAFAAVNAAQFPWLKTFKESDVNKLVDVPLSHISEKVYKTSVDWISQRSPEALQYFITWSLDTILDDLAIQAARGSKKVAQQAPLKSQVAIFVMLAMVLRRRPDLLISLLPDMKGSPKYQGQDKLPLNVWLISQASVGDLAVGLYMWAHFLLPMLSSRSTSNPPSRDLILQLVERILSAQKARNILINGAVRRGERLVPPSALDILMRATFPAPSARVKATGRFAAVYHTLKEIALAGSPESKAMKQTTQQILTFAVKAIEEDTSDLSREASDIFIWCLTQNSRCYKQWDVLYLENLEASVKILKRLSREWNQRSAQHLTLDPLRETVKKFRQKNLEELAKEEDDARHALLNEADKYSKIILGRLSRGHGCLKSIIFVSVALGAGAALLQFWDSKTLAEVYGLLR